MEPLEQVQRNTEEVIQLEEVENLLEEKENPRAYVGYETSGPVHLGHMTSVQKLLDVQEAGFEPVVLWADRHTYLNEKGDESWNDEETREWIDGMTEYWETVFDSLGLEAEFVKGSEFQHGDYMDDVLEMATNVSMKKATNSMGDIASSESLSVAQNGFYPLMQTLDIPHLDIDLAMGGIDQRGIHMKLAREELPELGYDKPAVLHYPLLTSLKGEGTKMSSSKPETMFPLHASEETVKNRISGAYFDPEELGEYPEGMTNSPVLQIADRFVFGDDRELEVVNKEYGVDETYGDLEELYTDVKKGEVHPQDVKSAVGDEISGRLQPVREEFKQNPELLEPLEKSGYETPAYIEN
ncbi:MAG: tyrosyl-tRNA synthetase [Candidatus Nanohaloarchaea archaeon]|jgi:tyrosyl-tRNA synthetase